MNRFDGVLLDIDGVLSLSWDPIPGAIETLDLLRREGVAFRLITNTTSFTRADLAGTLRAGGIGVEPDDVITAVVATASYLRSHHPDARVCVLSGGDAREDLEGVNLVDDHPDVVVIGGASEDFTFEALNRVFRMVMDGAALVGMHRNLYWRTNEGLQLDGGAYLVGIEQAAEREAVICGKPAAAYFEEALRMLGTPVDRTAMVGDDIVNDVLGAQAIGLTGVLVKTGKFLPADLQKGRPDHVIGSIADLHDLLRAPTV